MTCPCPQPSLHDRVLRAINIRNGTKCTDLVSAAARLLVKLREQEVDEADHNEQLDAPPEDYALLIADIDNETCCSEEATEIEALRSAVETARSMLKENLAEDLEALLAEMEENSPECAGVSP